MSSTPQAPGGFLDGGGGLEFGGGQAAEGVARRLASRVRADPIPGLGVVGDGLIDCRFADLAPLLHRHGLGQRGQIVGLGRAAGAAGSPRVASGEPDVFVAIGAHHPFSHRLNGVSTH